MTDKNVYDVVGYYRVEQLIDGKWKNAGKTHYRLGVFFEHAKAKRYAHQMARSDNLWKAARTGGVDTIKSLYKVENPAHFGDFFMARSTYQVPYHKAPHCGWQGHETDWTTHESKRADKTRRYIMMYTRVVLNSVLSAKNLAGDLTIRRLPVDKTDSER